MNLAKVHSLFNDDLSDSTVRAAGGGQYYNYSQNNYLTKLLQQFKDNPELLKDRLVDSYSTNSRFMNEMVGMSAKEMAQVTIETYNGYRKAGDVSDVGSTYGEMTPLDELATRVNQTLSGHLSMLTAADKGVWYLLKGFKLLGADMRYENGKYRIPNDSTVDVFGRYFMDELSRMRKAWNDLYGPNPIPESQRIQYYHGTPDKPGNAFRSYLFPELSAFRFDKNGKVLPMSEDAKSLGIFLASDNNKPTWNTMTVKQLRDVVREKLVEMVDKDVNEAVRVGLIGERDNGSLYNIGIDSKHISKENPNRDEAIRAAIADYSLNAMIANIETTKMFTGDPAFYKSTADLQKRVPGIIAPGKDLMLTDDIPSSFKVIVANDIKLDMAVDNKEIYDSYVEALMMEGHSEAKAHSLLESYKDIEVADAQGYVTLERYKDLLKGLGKWREEVMGPLFDKLEKGYKPSPFEKVYLQPLKGMYFAQDNNRGVVAPTYLKYSMAPLIPGMVKGTKLEKVLDKMTKDKDGNLLPRENRVDELVFNSGVKAGASGQVDLDLTTDEMSIMLDIENDVLSKYYTPDQVVEIMTGSFEEEIPASIQTEIANLQSSAQDQWSPITLENTNWKLQQDLSAKFGKKGEAIEGSQVIKNMLANIDPTAVYSEVAIEELDVVDQETREVTKQKVKMTPFVLDTRNEEALQIMNRISEKAENFNQDMLNAGYSGYVTPDGEYKYLGVPTKFNYTKAGDKVSVEWEGIGKESIVEVQSVEYAPRVTVEDNWDENGVHTSKTTEFPEWKVKAINPKTQKEYDMTVSEDGYINSMNAGFHGANNRLNGFKGATPKQLELEAFKPNMDGVRTGEDVMRDFINIDRAISDIGAEEFDTEFGMSEAPVIGTSISPRTENGELSPLYKTLLNKLKEDSAPDDVIELIEKGMPLDSITQYRKKIQQMILSILNKRTVKSNMPGGSFIQMSAAMFDYLNSEGHLDSDIIWLNGGKELKPPRMEDGVMKPGQILLPSKVVKKFRMANPTTKLTDLEIAMKAKELGLLEGVGYRIPNQDMASSDYLEVVGILPDYMGDTVVAFPQITGKTGSDFDIDKMYIMLPNYVATKNEGFFKPGAITSPKKKYFNYYREAILDMYGDEIDSNLNYNKTVNKDLYEDIQSIKAEIGIGFSENDDFAKTDEFKELRRRKNELHEYMDKTKFNEYLEIYAEKMVKDGLIESPEEFSKRPEHAKHNKRELQNMKIDSYKEILTSTATFARLVSPIDSKWMKDQVKDIREARAKRLGVKPDEVGMEFFNATYQTTAKRSFMGGQHGVGQIANHLVDHALTQMAGVGLASKLPRGNYGANGLTSFAGTKDDKGGLITSNVSAYLNAFVDIAKDPYIFDLNINTFTTNAAIMLVRAGYDPKWVNAFMSQPIIVDYTEAELINEGRTKKLKRHSKGPKKNKVITPKDEIRAKYASAGPSVIGENPSLAQLMNEISEPNNSNQQELLNMFLELKVKGDAFAKQVTAFKFDTNGAGKTMVESIINENKLQNALNDNTFIGVGRRLGGSMVETYIKNSNDKALQFMPGLFMGATKGAKAAIENIGKMLGTDKMTNIDLATSIENDLYQHLMTDMPGFSTPNPDTLFLGEGSVGAIAEYMKHDPSSKVKDNLFVQSLRITNEGERYFVKMSQGKKSKEAKQTLTEEWELLMSHPDANVSQWAKDLVKYSFASTGMNAKGGSFYDLIPASYMQEKGIDKYVIEKYRKIGGDGGASYTSSFVTKFFRNNWNNSKVVPQLEKSDVKKVSLSFGDNKVKLDKEDAISMNQTETSKKVIAGYSWHPDGYYEAVFKPFVNVGGKLYKIQGYNDIFNAETEKFERTAIYGRYPRLGFTGEYNNMKEYGDVKLSKFNDDPAPFTINEEVGLTKWKPATELVSDAQTSQTFSPLGKETSTVTQNKLNVLSRAIPNVKVVYDNTIKEIAFVRQGPDGPVLTINPDKIAEDTVIHEFGHILIAALGVDSAIVQEGIEQLRGSDLWHEVAEEYPELQGDALGEEVLATAIGREGAKLWNQKQSESKNQWMRWLDKFFDLIKKTLGINRSVAVELASTLLSEKMVEDGTNIKIDRIMFQKSLADRIVEEGITSIEGAFEDMRLALQSQMDNINQDILTKDRKNMTDAEKTQSDNYDKLKKQLRNLSETAKAPEQAKMVLRFVRSAQADMKAMVSTLEKKISEDSLSLGNLARMKEYLAMYDSLDSVLSLADTLSLNESLPERYKKLMVSVGNYIGQIKANHRRAQNLIDQAFPHVIAEANIGNSHRAETSYRLHFKREYDKKMGKTAKERQSKEYIKERDKYVNEEMSRNADAIKEAERKLITESVKRAKHDINMIQALMTDPRGMSDQLISIAVKELDRADYKSMTTYMRYMKDKLPQLMKFQKELGFEGNKGFDNVNKKFIKFPTKQGESPRLIHKKDKDYNNLTETEKEYVEFIGEMFVEADKNLNNNHKLRHKKGGYINLPSVRKSPIEKFMNGNFMGWMKESFIQKWKMREGDVDDVGLMPTITSEVTENEDGTVKVNLVPIEEKVSDATPLGKNPSEEEILQKVQEILHNKKIIKGMTESGDVVEFADGVEYKWYYNTETGEKYTRATSFIEDPNAEPKAAQRNKGESMEDYEA